MVAAIILAAGRGSRLKNLTDDTPKPLMRVNGRTLLERQIDAYRQHGVDPVAVVRGYLAERITPAGAVFFDNREWETTGLLPSLFTAEPVMGGGFLFSYGDTTFDPAYVGLILDALAAGHPMAGIVDVDWEKVYEGRDWHPPAEAENVTVDADGRVLRIGKNVPGEGSLGEFIGLAGLSAEAARAARDTWTRLLASDAPWGQKGTPRMGYAADLLQQLILDGIPMQAVPVHGGYREVDTPEDLERADKAVDW